MPLFSPARSGHELRDRNARQRWSYARWLFVLLLVTGASRLVAQTPAAEYRGFWAEAWSSDLYTASGVSRVINDLRSANCNMFVPQIRRRGDALYHSDYEPRCYSIDPVYTAGADGTFDPLADILAKAHDTSGSKQRIDVYAWIVTYHVWQSNKTYALPPQSNHPVNLHPDWLLKDSSGNTLIQGQYTFDPGHPEVQRHTFNVCMNIITNYDVDGLNFDYIRYSGTGEGYNDVTVGRFNRIFGREGIPATNDEQWKQFRRDQVTALLRKVYLNAIAVRPQVKISCDTITWSPSPTSDATWYSSSAAWNNIFQDWRGWMEEGILDINIPMNYFRQPVHGYHYTNWSNFAKDHRFNRHAVIGPGIYLNSAADAITQMRQPRAATLAGNTADGVCGYDYQVTNTNITRAAFLSALVSPSAHDPITPPIFSTPVPVPPMSWKSSPTKGHLMGYVYGSTNGAIPLDAAVVNLSGPEARAQTNDATGFYGFVDLTPGDYTVTASFPGHTSVASNVTVTVGTVSTRDLDLPYTAPPSMISSPQSKSVFPGQNVTFTVSAAGSPPLTYQWRRFGTNLPGAESTFYVISGVVSNDAGPYDVVVGNPYGAVTSAVAVLTVLPPLPPSRAQLLWSLAPGDRPYLTASSLPYERGMAYNLATHRLLVARRTPAVYVLDADTGADLHQLNTSGIAGGTYPLLMIGTAADGAIYAGNLTTTGATVPFTLYRWANDAPSTVPSIAFSDDPAPGNNQRWGDTLDVRGSGAGTQVIIGSRSHNSVVIFTTANGLTFAPRPVVVTNAPEGAFGLGIAFGRGNTFWGKANGQPLRQASFDLSTGTGAVIYQQGEPVVPNAVSPLGMHAGLNYLAGISISSPNHLRLYDLTVTNGTPVLLATNMFAANNDNTATGTGAVDFGTNTVYALAANNGLLALRMDFPRVVELLAPAFLPSGQFEFGIAGYPGLYRIESAINLASPNWQLRSTISSLSGSSPWIDPQPDSSLRWFRVLWLPPAP